MTTPSRAAAVLVAAVFTLPGPSTRFTRLPIARYSGRSVVVIGASFERLEGVPPCEGCPGTTERPALCDERLHVLCETCVPLASGRPRCLACGA